MVKAEEYKKYQRIKKILLLLGVITLPIIKIYTEYIAMWMAIALIVNNKILGNDYKIDNYIKVTKLSVKNLLMLNHEAVKRADLARKKSRIFLVIALTCFISVNYFSYFNQIGNQVIICFFTGLFAVYKYDEHMYRDFDSRVTHEIIARDERNNITEEDEVILEDLINVD